jgi:hypothetical protein
LKNEIKEEFGIECCNRRGINVGDGRNKSSLAMPNAVVKSIKKWKGGHCDRR